MDELGSASREEKELLKAFINEIDDNNMLKDDECIFHTIKPISNIENQISLMCQTPSM